MKRTKPRQHWRRLKSGKKVLVNKGVKKKAKRRMAKWHSKQNFSAFPSKKERADVDEFVALFDRGAKKEVDKRAAKK